jgi:amino acid transporter
MPDVDQKRRLRRAMGFGDLVLFFIITGFAVRWVPLAAAAGPSALSFWVLACLTFYVPLVFCVIELSSRYPDEGGLYVWTKHAFGEFAGFLTGWTYWTSVLPYFAGLLYFTAGNAL